MHLIVWCNLSPKTKAIESIYRYHDSAPNNSYTFQFAVPYGLKNTVKNIFSRINFDRINYSLFSVKKKLFFCFNLCLFDLIALFCNAVPVLF